MRLLAHRMSQIGTKIQGFGRLAELPDIREVQSGAKWYTASVFDSFVDPRSVRKQDLDGFRQWFGHGDLGPLGALALGTLIIYIYIYIYIYTVDSVQYLLSHFFQYPTPWRPAPQLGSVLDTSNMCHVPVRKSASGNYLQSRCQILSKTTKHYSNTHTCA